MPFVGSGHIWMIGILLLIVLIVWGPGKLPDVGSGMGRAIREFRNASENTNAEFSKAAAPQSAPETAATSATMPVVTAPVSPNCAVEPAPAVGGGPTTEPSRT
jgi:TatA/E family protein of Tat protein translocase